jgi:hypothetical protein
MSKPKISVGDYSEQAKSVMNEKSVRIKDILQK